MVTLSRLRLLASSSLDSGLNPLRNKGTIGKIWKSFFTKILHNCETYIRCNNIREDWHLSPYIRKQLSYLESSHVFVESFIETMVSPVPSGIYNDQRAPETMGPSGATSAARRGRRNTAPNRSRIFSWKRVPYSQRLLEILGRAIFYSNPEVQYHTGKSVSLWNITFCSYDFKWIL